MSFNDLDPELRDKVRKSIDIFDDMEFAAGVLLDRIDDQSSYDKHIGGVFEEIFDNTDLRLEVGAADVYVVEE